LHRRCQTLTVTSYKAPSAGDENRALNDAGLPYRSESHGPVQSWILERGTPVEYLHTTACGDFTMLSREQWHRLHGYPEFEAFSFHIDSLFCYMAHYSG